MISIKKYRLVCFLCFLFPLIAVNLSLITYKLLGKYNFYPSFNWDNVVKKDFTLNDFSNLDFIDPITDKPITLTEAIKDEDIQIINIRDQIDIVYKDQLSYLECPKFSIEKTIYFLKNGKAILSVGEKIHYPLMYFKYKDSIEKIRFVLGEKSNNYCIKENSYLFSLIKFAPFIEKLFIKSVLNSKGGISLIKNPYFFGEVSISRTARIHITSNYIFKPFLILASFTLFFYWINNFRILNNTQGINSKSYLILGIFSAIFLSLHALGIDIQQKLSFNVGKIRSFILTSFILSEIFAQFFFARILYKNSTKLFKISNYKIIVSKMIFVWLVLIIFVSFVLFDFFTGYKGPLENIVEWNFFNFLLIYFLISLFLWKNTYLDIQPPPKTL